MPSPATSFNGINAATGDYGLTLSADQLVQRVFGDATADELQARSEQYAEDARNRPDIVRSVHEGIDGTDLSQAGWGVIFAHADPQIDAIQEALEPLLALRREQAGRFYRAFTGVDAYRPGESKSAFLRRFGVGAGAVDPKQGVPYYLLLIGGPELIPYAFQYQLDVQFAVGRLDLESPDAYAAYARTVVAADRGELALPRAASFFSVVNPDDSATAATDDYLVGPLRQALMPQTQEWEIFDYRRSAATRPVLKALLGGEQKPALLFTASHGIEFPLGDPRQARQQGALLCSEWPGPQAWRGRGALPEEYYFAGDHLAATADPSGMIAFHFACFGGGTPQYNDFAHGAAFPDPNADPTAEAIAERPFTAHLPRRLLGHPRGGALAVVSHVDRAWSYSFRLGETPQTRVFESALTRLLQGKPLGWALEFFDNRYAELAADLNNEIGRMRWGSRLEPFELAALWTENNDARNYVILGDPAVRLAVPGVAPPDARLTAVEILPDGRPASIPADAWRQTPPVVQRALTDALRLLQQQEAGAVRRSPLRSPTRGGATRSATRGGLRGGGS